MQGFIIRFFGIAKAAQDKHEVQTSSRLVENCREIISKMQDLVGVQEVRWEKDGFETTDDICFMELEMFT
jgi:hypothetical protein